MVIQNVSMPSHGRSSVISASLRYSFAEQILFPHFCESTAQMAYGRFRESPYVVQAYGLGGLSTPEEFSILPPIWQQPFTAVLLCAYAYLCGFSAFLMCITALWKYTPRSIPPGICSVYHSRILGTVTDRSPPRYLTHEAYMGVGLTGFEPASGCFRSLFCANADEKEK